MNLILLEKKDFCSPQTVCLKDRRHRHMAEVLRSSPGDTLAVGLINGPVGRARITHMDTAEVQMDVVLDTPPPHALPATLVLALPRPIVLKRILSTVASLGVKKLILIHSRRVEKSFWKSPVLGEAVIRGQLLLGLEQARDTMLPEVMLRRRFKPFMEDEMPALVEGTQAFVAHPKGELPCPRQSSKPVTLAVGPEGGWVDCELEKFKEAGFQTVDLGERILRVETVIPYFLAKLF